MKPPGRIVVGVYAGVVGGEVLHLIEAMLGGIGGRNIAHVPLAGKVCGVAFF